MDTVYVSLPYTPMLMLLLSVMGGYLIFKLGVAIYKLLPFT